MRGLLPLVVAAAVLLVTAPALSAPVIEAPSSVVCTARDARLTEISGMAVSAVDPSRVWVHNDSGDAARLYALNLRTCAVVAELSLRGVDARDWEGMAAGLDAKGRPVLWVGDIGDNRSSWTSVSLLRVREPAGSGAFIRSARTFDFTYRDRPHDAETLLVNPLVRAKPVPYMWVATKQLARGRIYALPTLRAKRVVTARPVGDAGAFVTDGAVRPDGRGFVIRDYLDAHIYRGLPPGEKMYTVRLPAQVQGEAITWSADGRSLLVMSERDDRLIRVTLPEQVLRSLY